MVELHSIIELIAQKSTIKRYAEVPLLLEKWRELKDLVNTLRIPYKATVDLQRRDLTLSDTYGIWLEIKLRLKKAIDSKTSNTDLAVTMLDAFNSRYDNIFSNPAMKAAIFLDPRYRMGIVRDQLSVEEAKKFIMDMHRRLNYLKSTDSEPNCQINRDDSDDNFDVQSEMCRFWDCQADTFNLNRISDFEAALDSFDPQPMNIKDNLFHYWQNYDIELREVAMAIFAMPPTETQVERDFSVLKRILSDLRGNLSAKTLEDILTINLNKDIYLEVIAKQVADNRIKQKKNINK